MGSDDERTRLTFFMKSRPDALEFMKDEASVEDFSFLRNYVHGVVFNSRRDDFQGFAG